MSTQTMRRLRLVSEPSPTYKPPREIKGKVNEMVMFDAYKDYFASLAQETLIAVALNTTCEIIGYSEIARGGSTNVTIPTGNILQFLILANSKNLVLLHNHPGQITATPSQADIDSTMTLQDACGPLKIRLLDHIICCTDNYFSFRKNGLLKPI